MNKSPAGKGSKTRKMRIDYAEFDVRAKDAGIDTKNPENIISGKRVYNAQGREIITRRQYIERSNAGLMCVVCREAKDLLPCKELDKKYRTKFAEKGPFICLQCATAELEKGK